MTRRGTNGSGAGGSLGQTLARRRSGRAKSNGSTAAGANGAGTSGTQGSGLELLPVINLAPDHPCVDCAQCCHYVAIEIDAPTTMTEYDYMLWYLVHPGVSVFVDFDNAWFVKFDSRCQHLQPNGMCGIYETRPVICREFDWKECERHLVDEPADKWLFTGADAFLAWFEKQRPRTYKKFLAFQKEHRRKKTPKELRRVKITALPLPPP
jgi:Fe-S-cluster containining protein